MTCTVINVYTVLPTSMSAVVVAKRHMLGIHTSADLTWCEGQ
jgi:hypothetical protein